MLKTKEFEVHIVHLGTTPVEAPAPLSFDVQTPVTPESETGTAGEEETRIYRMPAVGGGGGAPFEFLHWDKQNNRYHPVTALHVWITSGKAMRCVSVDYDDGFSQLAGKASEHHYQLNLHPEKGELITRTILYSSSWQSKNSLRCNGIDIRTDFPQQFAHAAGDVFDFEHFGILSKPTPSTDLTRGTLVGIHGATGQDVDRLGLILELPQDEEYIFEDVQYDLNSMKLLGEKPLSIKEQTVENPTNATLMQQIMFSHTHTDTKTWAHTLGCKLGVKTSFKTGVPFIAEGKVEVSFEASYSYTWGGSAQDAKTDTWSATLSAPPHSHLRATGVVTQASISVPFTAKLTKRKSDGSQETVPLLSGIYEGVNVSKFHVEIEDLDPQPPPPRRGSVPNKGR